MTTPRRDDRPTSPFSVIRLVAIALVLIGVWFLRSREASPPVTTPTPTPAPTSSARAPAQAPVPRAAEVSDDERHDLEEDERRGGHTLARHVGRTDAQLRERLVSEPDISSASTYTTRALAERTVARTLRENAGRVQAWLSRGGSRSNLALDYRGPRSEIIGRNIRRGRGRDRDRDRDPVECTNAIVVLRSAGRDYYVLTSYPEPSH